MQEQGSLFTDAPEPDPDIPGLLRIPDFITPEQEKRLILAIDKRDWITEIKRRVQHYGYRYSYKPGDKKLAPADSFPQWAVNLSKKIVGEKLMKEIPDQLIVNEYEPGQGISAHVDREELFGEKIVSVSLGSDCIMEFIHTKTRDRVSVVLKRRSALLMEGEARHDWTHGIPARLTDEIQGEKVKRSRRVSLTFRNVKKDAE